MTDIADPDIADPDDAPPTKSKLPLVLGLVLALVGGGGGFMAVQLGFIGGSSEGDHDAGDAVAVSQLPPIAFVPLDPLIINLPPQSEATYLRFVAQLEVEPENQETVEAIRPRIVDVLNGYLRAVSPDDLEDPTALSRLRAQMLRRIQVVAGDGRVRDLLIMEFVLN